MARGCGLRHLNDAYDVTHAEIPTEQKAQNPQAHTIRELPLELEAHVMHKSLLTPLLVEYSDRTDG